MMMLPMPPFLLDVFFTFKHCPFRRGTAGLRVRPAALGFRRISDHSAGGDPAATGAQRRVHPCGHAPRSGRSRCRRKVIQAFGEFVIGGNYAVGIVVFAILTIINFVVITKGAGRVSEVTARFILDAMPGKQMAIDADLNAGLIDQNQAKSRRLEVAQEAEFYGSRTVPQVRAR
ncbi:FHIPEP family domain-containing protein [Ditylenchus destructor]|nr:FHIPEP family domain-containing protein [Ditylenchus destructor]